MADRATKKLPEPWSRLPPLPPRGRPRGLERAVWPVLFAGALVWVLFALVEIGRCASQVLPQ